MQNKGLHKLNLWLEKKLFFPGCTNKQLQGNKTVFENHIFLAIYALIYCHYLIDFCTTAYYIYPLYDCIQQSVYLISVTATFISQTSPGYTYFYQFYDAPADILLLSFSWEGYPPREALFSRVFPMFLLPFRDKGPGYQFRCFLFFVFWLFSWWS